jgi:hypothetical protein
MITRFAVPFIILAVLFLPLPFVPGLLVLAVLLAVGPRGEPDCALVPCAPSAGPTLLRGPPR